MLINFKFTLEPVNTSDSTLLKILLAFSLEIDLFKNYHQLPAVIFVSFFGFLIGKVIRLPGYTITGPMIFSATLHVLGLVNAMPIYLLIII